MDIKEVIQKRRAYRSLDKVEITEELAKDLAGCAQLAPSCFNHQPWRYVFAYDPVVLKKLHGTLSKGNEWARDASMIIAVFSHRSLDCIIKKRVYYAFDTGMATAFLILRATERGMVTHPIAGFDEDKAKKILGIPEKMRLITLVIVGRHSEELKPALSEQQKVIEQKRPERKSIEEIAFLNTYRGGSFDEI
ncbi:MAG: nitroreductase [Rhodospirillaceae bacterium]|nr:nitroreductase [Rhodospirillaceae bacterium]